MGKLKPIYLYRLRMLRSAPRFYAPQPINRYLEKRGLIRPTGRTHPDQRHAEYAITEAGLRALEASISGAQAGLDGA